MYVNFLLPVQIVSAGYNKRKNMEVKLYNLQHLTLNSIMPLKYYYGKWSICSFGANVTFSIIFSKVFINFSSFFFPMLSKNRILCHDLKIAYVLKSNITLDL